MGSGERGSGNCCFGLRRAEPPHEPSLGPLCPEGQTPVPSRREREPPTRAEVSGWLPARDAEPTADSRRKGLF